MAGSAAVGRNQHHVLVIRDIDQWRDTLLAGLASGRSEQQNRTAGHSPAELAAAEPVERCVYAGDEALHQNCGLARARTALRLVSGIHYSSLALSFGSAIDQEMPASGLASARFAPVLPLRLAAPVR